MEALQDLYSALHALQPANGSVKYSASGEHTLARKQSDAAAKFLDIVVPLNS